MKNIIYVKMKKNIQVSDQKLIKVKDVILPVDQEKIPLALGDIPLYKISEKDQENLVIDYFLIVRILSKYFPELHFKLIGEPYSIIKIKKKRNRKSFLLTSLIWILLFIGTAMTIMNFHYDVSMQEVQQKLYFLMTGKEEEFPLFIQIPYSLGLGLGMLLFFNHWFKKKFTDEPSPLDVELHNYQKDIDDYIINHENILKDE